MWALGSLAMRTLWELALIFNRCPTIAWSRLHIYELTSSSDSMGSSRISFLIKNRFSLWSSIEIATLYPLLVLRSQWKSFLWTSLSWFKTCSETLRPFLNRRVFVFEVLEDLSILLRLAATSLSYVYFHFSFVAEEAIVHVLAIISTLTTRGKLTSKG